MRKSYDLLDWAKVEGEPEQSLANAIVITAARDYKAAIKRLRNPLITGQDKAFTERTRVECEMFFRSSLFEIFCNLNGEELMKALRREAQMEARR